MRGPVGLVAAPDEGKDTTPCEHVDDRGVIAVEIERSLLAPPHLKDARLLVNVEWYGRFWVCVEGMGTTG